jgi:hypothetical protein
MRRHPMLQPLESRLLMTTLYWDADPLTPGLQAGSGTWDESAPNWNTASDGSGSNVAWDNNALDSAVFSVNAGSPATITIDDIQAANVTFNATGYTVTGGTLAYQSAEIDQNLTVTGGTWSDGAFTNNATLTINGGHITAGSFTNNGPLNLQSGSLEVYADGESYAPITFTGGSFIIDSGYMTNYDDFVISGTASHTLSGGGILTGNSFSWSGGNVTCTADLDFYSGDFTMDGGSAYTFTLNGASLSTGGSGLDLAWNSGKIRLINGATIDINDGNADTLTVGGTVTLDLSDGSITGTITNEGTLHLADSDPSALSNIDNSGTVVFDANVDLSGLTLSGGTYELSSGHTADVTTTLAVTGATLTIDSGATLDWSGGNLSIGSGGSFANYGTLTITTSGNITGSTGVTGFHDYSSMGYDAPSEVKELADAATAPDFSGSGPPYDWSATASVQLFNTDGTRNTSGWWDGVDTTAIPESIGGNGILITPRDMIFALHNGVGIGAQITFLGSNGVTYNRTVRAIYYDQSTLGDIEVATLDSDLPSYVKPMNLLPSDYQDYFLNSSQYPPVVYTNQDRTLLIAQYAGVVNIHETSSGSYYQDNDHLVQSSDAVLQEFFYPGSYPTGGIARPGDSGSPVMMLINGELTLMGVWHYVGYAPDAASYITQINSAIAANAAYLSGGPYAESTTYTVSTVSLAGFTNYSALL